jgi:5,5'-dehydrodivanillate O-demethylase
MLSKDDQELLTNVDWGSPMAQLLSRYWYPITTADELSRTRTLKFTLLGRTFVLFKDTNDNLGVLDNRCPHRGAALHLGIPTSDGIRCPYHGWEFGRHGDCTGQPCEHNPAFKTKVRVESFSAVDLFGIIFVYVGPSPAPALPPYDLCRTVGCHRRFRAARIPCNWLQIVENALDPTHLEWLHGHYVNYLEDKEGRDKLFDVTAHEQLGFERTDYGIVKRRTVAGQEKSSDDWNIGQHFLMPTWFRVGSGDRYALHIRVPNSTVETTYVWIEYFLDKPVAEDDMSVEFEVFDYLDSNGNVKMDTVDGQDIAVFLSQGPVVDRTDERLGQADQGIIMLRSVLKDEIQQVLKDNDPLGVFRGEDISTVEFAKINSTKRILSPLSTRSFQIQTKSEKAGRKI